MIHLLGISQINLDQLKSLTSERITYPVERSTSKTPLLNQYLSALSCFQNPENETKSVQELIKNSASLSRLIHIIIGVEADEQLIIKSIKATQLNHVSNESLTLISGTLQEWKVATLECCSRHQDPRLLELYNKIVILFERMGLRDIWYDTTKEASTDGNFYLSIRENSSVKRRRR